MTPEFATLVNPTFHYVLDLTERIQRGESVDLRKERAVIRSGLEEAENRASSDSCAVRLEDFRLAKMALIYWIDEVLTVADRNWQSITLEWDYYGTRDRAWKFYVDGELKARKASPDVVEVWYLCLVLGFEGDVINAFLEHLKDSRFEGMEPEQCRKAWAAELAQQIRQQKLPELPGRPLEGDVRPLTGGPRLAAALKWTLALFTLFLVLLYFAFGRR
ncbi:MAG: DotU family type IV/VI secretion system protein [Planctomycetes bacterium]|nr:DotU family type IV/VI secretion system protein [Planctomycetota bacterium]